MIPSDTSEEAEGSGCGKRQSESACANIIFWISYPRCETSSSVQRSKVFLHWDLDWVVRRRDGLRLAIV